MSRIVESLYAKYDLADDELTIEVDDEVETEIVEEEPEIVEPEPEVEEIESEEEIIEEACGDKDESLKESLSEDEIQKLADEFFDIYLWDVAIPNFQKEREISDEDMKKILRDIGL